MDRETGFDPDAGDGDLEVEPDDQLQPEDTLIDRGVDDILDEGVVPPDMPYRGDDDPEGSVVDQRLDAENPDPTRDGGYYGVDYETEDRSGRLVAPDEGTGPDTEARLVAGDVGIDGGAAAAEEAAVHYADSSDPDAPGGSDVPDA